MTTLVGREKELALLADTAREAAAGGARVCLVTGPAGIGKTALVRAFMGTLSDTMAVRWACGDEDERNLPYGILEQLGVAGPRDLDWSETDHFLAGARIVQALSGDSSCSPGVCLVVDDLPWADRPSLLALAFSLRRLRADPVLTVLICRDEELDQIPEGLSRLAANSGPQLDLPGLDTDELVELSSAIGSSTLSRPAAERLGRHTAGNPLHAIALMVELHPADLEGGEEPLPAPRSYSTLVVARLARCGPQTRALVAAASVLGRRSHLDLAVRLAGLLTPAPALDEAVEGGFLTEVPPDAEIAFVHPLMRSAVYHDLAPGSRRELHARAAGLLDDESAALRHRVAAAITRDPDLARDAAGLGERQAAKGNWAGAAEAFAAAERLSGQVGEREGWALRRIECQLLHGGVAEARGGAEQARTFAPSARREFVLSQLAAYSGWRQEAAERLRRAWDSCHHPEDDHLAARIAIQLGHLAVNAGRGEETVGWARRALALGQDFPPPDATTVLCLGMGEPGRGRQALAELPDAPPLLDDELGSQDVDNLIGRGILQLWTDDLTAARQSLERAESVVAVRGSLQLRLVALIYLADAEYRAGQWKRAVLHGQLAVSLAHDANQAWTFALVHSVASFPLAGQGRWDSAERHVVAAAEAASTQGDGASILWSCMSRARVASARGDDAGVCSALQPMDALVAVDGSHEPGIQPWRSLLAGALIGLHRLDEAEVVLHSVEGRAREREHRSELVRAARLRGLLLGARGRLGDAEEVLAAGYELDPQRRSPLDAALLEIAHGSVLRRAGKRRAAAAALGAASQRLAALDARPFLRIAEREAAGCGLKPRSRRAPSPGLLSPQESAVATLVSSGMTNRQVANELVVSVKTIEYHLGSVFTKLGVSTRASLAACLLGANQPQDATALAEKTPPR